MDRWIDFAGREGVPKEKICRDWGFGGVILVRRRWGGRSSTTP